MHQSENADTRIGFQILLIKLNCPFFCAQLTKQKSTSVVSYLAVVNLTKKREEEKEQYFVSVFFLQIVHSVP